MRREPLSLRAKALALLATREYSRRELLQKLRAHAGRLAQAGMDNVAECVAQDTITDIEALLDEFAERGWLSEERYVEQAVTSLSRRYGPRRIVQRLEAKGIGRESVTAVMPYLQSEALATAKTLLERKFRGPVASAEDKARRVRYLQGRGFDYDVIRKALSELHAQSLTDTESGN